MIHQTQDSKANLQDSPLKSVRQVAQEDRRRCQVAAMKTCPRRTDRKKDVDDSRQTTRKDKNAQRACGIRFFSQRTPLDTNVITKENCMISPADAIRSSEPAPLPSKQKAQHTRPHPETTRQLKQRLCKPCLPLALRRRGVLVTCRRGTRSLPSRCRGQTPDRHEMCGSR